MSETIDPLLDLPLLATLLNPIALGDVVNLLIIFSLLLLSALFSGSEIAYFSLDPNHISQLRDDDSRLNRVVLHHLDRPKTLLATILIANNMVNIGIVILSTFTLNNLFNLEGFPLLAFLIQVIGITAFLLIFGEIMPKIYSTKFPLKVARSMAVVLNVLIRVFYPLSIILVKSTNVIDKRISRGGQNITMDDLEEAIELTSEDLSSEEISDEKRLLKGIVRFGDIEASEVMTARIDVTAVENTTDFTALQQLMSESGFSRIPVYEENFDHVLGVIYIKDLIPHLDQGKDFDWLSIIRPAFFIPENKRISDLLKEFQEKQIHMAIVVDEYGGTSGIVTLEDIIEEIVGEINDEFDRNKTDVIYTRIEDNVYIFDAKTSINDFSKILEIDDEIFDKIRGEAESLAGLYLEMAGQLPKKGEKVNYKNFEFSVEEADNRRIVKLKITLKHA